MLCLRAYLQIGRKRPFFALRTGSKLLSPTTVFFKTTSSLRTKYHLAESTRRPTEYQIACRNHATSCPLRSGATCCIATGSKDMRPGRTLFHLQTLIVGSALIVASISQSRTASSSQSTVLAETTGSRKPEQPAASTATWSPDSTAQASWTRDP